MDSNPSVRCLLCKLLACLDVERGLGLNRRRGLWNSVHFETDEDKIVHLLRGLVGGHRILERVLDAIPQLTILNGGYARWDLLTGTETLWLLLLLLV